MATVQHSTRKVGIEFGGFDHMEVIGSTGLKRSVWVIFPLELDSVD